MSQRLPRSEFFTRLQKLQDSEIAGTLPSNCRQPVKLLRDLMFGA